MPNPVPDPRQQVSQVCASFAYLTVETCLNTMPGIWGAYLDRVTTQGFDEQGFLNAYGLLQVCLLGCELFRDSPEGHIWDVRDITPRLSRPCQNRPMLLEALAEVLYVYERQCHVTFDVGQAFRKGLMDICLMGVKQGDVVLRLLRERNMVPMNPKLHHLRTTTVHSAFETVTRVIEGLTIEDFTNAGFPDPNIPSAFTRVYKNSLLVRMRGAFRQYSPLHYWNGAIHSAIATILKSFGIRDDTGQALTPVAIQKRLQRFKG